MTTMRLLALVLCVLPASFASAKMRTTADFQAAMERSDVNYEIDQLTPEHERDAASTLWPEGRAHDCPELRVVDGKKSVVECPDVAPGAKQAFTDAEKLFKAKDYEAARKKYEEVKRLSPSSSLLDLYIGDSLFFSLRWSEALAAYDHAIQANPLQYRGHLFRAHTLIKLRRFDEAREALIDALVLRPRNPTAMKMAHSEALHLGIMPYEEAFKPRASARRLDPNHVRVETVASPHWMAFAVCEAYWVGEEQPKRSGWTSEEAHECLANLIAMYQTRAAAAPAEPQLGRLSDVAMNAHMLDEFIIYEVGSRIMPDLPLILDDAVRAKLRRYIAQYVLPRAIASH
jgi:tetratricopeptide (TPR) repeat protein